MALLERVTTLLRANLNDLVDRAENPEVMLKQVILDMENQLLQVKTQVAISIADHHLLERKCTENQDKSEDWMRKAGLALGKQDDELARTAVERALSCRQLAESFSQQIADQKVQVENLKTALQRLDQKLVEAKSKAELLGAQSRRARAMNKASQAQMASAGSLESPAFARLTDKVQRTEAVSAAHVELLRGNVDDRFAALDREEKVDRILAELKSRRIA